MSYFTEQSLYDSKTQFFDERLTCWMACLMSWTRASPFDTYVDNIEKFTTLMNNRRWRRDEERDQCMKCQYVFGMWNRKHHCRLCGDVFCATCSEVKEIKCCYRENLFIRCCHGCYEMFDARWKLFHNLQRTWIASEGRLSDCLIPNHPYFSDYLKTSNEERNAVPQPNTIVKHNNTQIGPKMKTKMSKSWTLFVMWAALFLLQFIILTFYFLNKTNDQLD